MQCLWQPEVGWKISGELTMPRKLSQKNLLWIFWACEISSTFDLGHDWISPGIKATGKNGGGLEDFLVSLWWLLPGESHYPVCWRLLLMSKLVTSVLFQVFNFPFVSSWPIIFHSFSLLLPAPATSCECAWIVFCIEISFIALKIPSVVGYRKKKSSTWASQSAASVH